MTPGQTARVVIPARNERRWIGACIESVQRQAYPATLVEIVVADGGSSDGTPDLAAAAGARTVFAGTAYPGVVRNAGASDCRSDILAFVDGDCEAGPDWLATAVELFADPSIGAVGGGCTVDSTANWVERAWVSDPPERPTDVRTLPGASMIVRSSVFREVGGFRPDLSATEDDDLSRRIASKGLRLVSHPRCFVVHRGYPRTLLGVARRQVWHGSYQLDGRGASRDSMVIATHVFLAGLVAWPTMAMVFGPWSVPAAAAGALVFGTVLAAAGKRELVGRRSPNVGRLMARSSIYLFFFLGRSAGLLKNYWRVLRP
jgi:glycosyltransferase involved in cell wall biosynthesis